jgi:diguanylate cyclase (GGDEF)-like protein
MEKIKGWFLKIGIFRSVIVLVFLVIIISILLTTGIMLLTGGKITRPGIIASVVTTGATTAFFSIIILKLLFDLDETGQKFTNLSRQDDLTGISNRRAFIEIAERELDRAIRYGVEFSIVMFDINEFKNINDRFGYVVGDKMLQEIAHQCQVRIRNTDHIARWGGDEFVVLVPQSEDVDLEQYCTRIIQIIRNIHLIDNNQSIRVSASIGVKRYTDEITSIDDIFHLADRDMYQIKDENRFKW